MVSNATVLVVHRMDDVSVVLGRLVDPPRHFTALEPFASRLRLEGRATGELVLLEEGTRRLLARYRLDRPPTGHCWTAPPPRRVPRTRPPTRPIAAPGPATAGIRSGAD